MKREWQKLAWYLPRAIISAGFLFLFTALANHRAGAVVLFSAWMLAIQYYDYPFDNHKSAV